jgi:hypothetical protein
MGDDLQKLGIFFQKVGISLENQGKAENDKAQTKEHISSSYLCMYILQLIPYYIIVYSGVSLWGCIDCGASVRWGLIGSFFSSRG